MSIILGNNIIGATQGTIEGAIKGSVFTSGTADYIVEKISVYYQPTDPLFTTKCAIYNDTALVANSETSEITGVTGPAWREFTYPGTKPVLSPNTTYTLVAWAQSRAGTNLMNLNTATGAGRTQTIVYAASFPNPASFSINDSLFSIYATLWVGYALSGSTALNFAVASACEYSPAISAPVAMLGFDEGLFDEGLFDGLLDGTVRIYPLSIVDPPPLVLYPAGAISASVIGTHVIGVSIIVPGIGTRETFGRLRLSLTIGMTGIPSAGAFGTPTLSPGAPHTIKVPTIYLDA